MQRAAPWILAVLAGVVLALAMPGPGLWPLALLFPGLLLESLERSKGWWQPLLLGWAAGTVHWVVATHWVHEVMHHYGGLPWIGVRLKVAAPARDSPGCSDRLWVIGGAPRRLPPYALALVH